MNKNVVLNVLLFLTLMVSNISHAQDNLPVLVGDYIGQKPPGLTPEPFAPGVISTEGYEYSGVFTPDMDEFSFIRGGEDNTSQEFVTYQKTDDQWFGEVKSPRIGQPTISPDGKIMHLGRRYIERINHDWSERKNLDLPFTDILIMRLTSASNGTYYFDTWDESNEDFPIRYSRIVEGKYEDPKPLSKTINTGTQLNHPYIAPDESYLIWDAVRSDGYGDSDLYISYRQNDGDWGDAINLGDKINTSAWDAAEYVTPDGKYFFFNRLINPGVGDELPNVDIYWVDAQFIETLRPKS